MPSFIRRSEMPVSAEALYAWHTRPGAFERLTPPWQPVKLVASEGVAEGMRAEIRLGIPPITLRWIAEHRDVKPGRQFRDVQIEGPFAAWDHLHRMIPHDIAPDRSTLSDEVTYALPAERLLERIAGDRPQDELIRLFGYRHRVTHTDLERHLSYGGKPMTVAVTGSSGLIGSALTAFLMTGGHTVVRLVRSQREAAALPHAQHRAVHWDPDRGTLDAAQLEGVDAVIHLAGESVLGPWTRGHRARILQSRARGTRVLAEALASMERPPKTFLSASATGFYGDQAIRVNERSRSGDTFLAEVCRAWEAATEPAEAAGIRVCHLRIGVVQTPAGGVLRLAYPAFLAGLGGVPGSPKTWMPWIALDDVLYAILHLLRRPDVRGAVNLTSPHPVPMRTWARTLGRLARRPVWLPLPERLLRLGPRAVTDELLAGARVQPDRLLNSGFAFAYPALPDALAHVLGRHAD